MAIDLNVKSTPVGREQAVVTSPTARLPEFDPTLQRVRRVSPGLWRDAAWRLSRDRAAVAGLLVVAVLVVVAILAPAIAPYDPIDQSFRIKLQAPSSEHLLGTDEFGRDVLSRSLVGTPVAFRLGVIPVLIALVAGVSLGLVSGYFGGAIDQIVMRLIDILLAFPWLLLAIGIVAILGP